jgi:hypothetical protein
VAPFGVPVIPLLWHFQALSDAQFTADADEINAQLLVFRLPLTRHSAISQVGSPTHSVAIRRRGAAIHLIRAV